MLVYAESLARGRFHRQKIKLDKENLQEKKSKALNKKVKKRKNPASRTNSVRSAVGIMHPQSNDGWIRRTSMMQA